MSKGSGTTLAKIADTMALIMWQPRTIKEIVELTEIPHTTISNHIKALHAAGVIYVLLIDENGGRVWAVQPEKPFGEGDAK